MAREALERVEAAPLTPSGSSIHIESTRFASFCIVFGRHGKTPSLSLSLAIIYGAELQPPRNETKLFRVSM